MNGEDDENEANKEQAGQQGESRGQVEQREQLGVVGVPER